MRRGRSNVGVKRSSGKGIVEHEAEGEDPYSIGKGRSDCDPVFLQLSLLRHGLS